MKLANPLIVSGFSVLITTAIALGFALTPSAARADATPHCGGNKQKICGPTKAKRLVDRYRRQPSGTKKALGYYWSCPSGYKKVVLRKWNSSKACKQKRKTTKAKNHGSVENRKPAGSIYNLKTKAYWSCPAGYLRKPLAKIDSTSACIVKRLGGRCDRGHIPYKNYCRKYDRQEGFVKRAVKESKEIRKLAAPLLKLTASFLKEIGTKKNLKNFRRLKSESQKEAFLDKLASKFIDRLHAWKKKTRKTSLDVRLASADPDDPSLWASHNPNKSEKWPWKSMSLGVVFDVSAIGGWSPNPYMQGYDHHEEDKTKRGRARYRGRAWALGATLGIDGGFEIGFWKDTYDDLSGQSHGFVGGGGVVVSGTVGWHWTHRKEKPDKKLGLRFTQKKTKDGRFLGMTVTATVGGCIEFEYTWGRSVFIRIVQCPGGKLPGKKVKGKHKGKGADQVCLDT